ncbi:hypothetical protein HDU67_002292 [Dinochytrium kinnereticum]|nr:hypothetical protein HDU67_002292 [Dinochytrium kinnereticum]
MSPKKQHEVEIMACLIDHLASKVEESESEPPIQPGEKTLGVLDLGAGQGYLDSVLTFQYNRLVIGVDDDTVQTCGAKRRTDKLHKLYQHQSKMDPLQKRQGAGGVKKGNLFHVNRRVDAKESFKDLLREVRADLKSEEDSSASTPATLHHFLNSDAALLVCVGCCYNKLTEDAEPSQPVWESTKDTRAREQVATTLNYERVKERQQNGYPMSEYFRSNGDRFRLGFTARTLACQATSRWTTDDGARDAYRRHHYRALLQHVICHRGLLPHVQKRDGELRMTETGEQGLIIGRLKPHAFAKGFAWYAQFALGRLGVDIERLGLTHDVLSEYENEFAEREKEIAVVWTLRAMIGSAIESLIVVDRFMFLVEAAGGVDFVDGAMVMGKGGKMMPLSVRVFPLFGLVDSPRNMVIVAEKLDAGMRQDEEGKSAV